MSLQATATPHTQPSTLLFPYERWEPQLNELARRCQAAQPYPHGRFPGRDDQSPGDYTTDDSAAASPRSTNYRARPGDGWRSLGIWLDNRALAMYSWAKRTFGISDAFVSKVLGFLSPKK